MPAIRITETAVHRALQDAREAGSRIELTDAVALGLRLRVTKNGQAMWSLMLRDQAGRNRRFNLGEFPTLRVSEAREQAGITRHRVRQEGADPVADKRAVRQASLESAPAEMTLTGLLDEFTRVVKHDSETWLDYRHRVELVFKPLLDKPASSLSLSDLQRTADSYPALGGASRSVAYLRPVLKWGAARDYVDFKTTLISPPRPNQQRDRVLTPDELRALLVVLRGGVTRHSGYAGHRAALLMILFTATRRSEVCEATWSEFSLDQEAGRPIWTIPASRIKDTRRAAQKSRKKKQPHVVPLSHQAVTFLMSRRPENWGPNDLVFPNEARGVLGNWDRVTKYLFGITGTSGWTRHDLRRTAATMMGELGTPPHVVESVLNHATIHSSLADTYNRSRYLTEVGEALQKWADWVDGLVIERGVQ